MNLETGVNKTISKITRDEEKDSVKQQQTRSWEEFRTKV